MRKKAFFVALFAAVLLSSAAGAQILYGIGYNGDNGPSTLYTVDPATGAATAVGAVGFERCSGMDFSAGGVLYAACERSDGSNIPVLITIDTASGAGTEVGPTSFSGAVGDISFRSDGVLFAYDAINDPTHTLFTINTTTGAGTEVGDTGLSFAGGNGMAFDAAGVLYQSQFSGGPNPDLNTLDPATATPTFVGQLPPTTGRFAGMDLDPSSGVIYGVLKEGASTGPTFLATIDPVGLSENTIGATEGTLDAIAFGPAGAPVVEVPMLGLGSLLGLVLLLAAGGAFLITKR